jgi:hypothetical protein
VDNGVNVGGKRGRWSWCDWGDGRLLVVRGRLVIVIVVVVVVVFVVVIVVVFVIGAYECKVYFAAGGCCLCVEVNVGEEEATSASADGG